MSVRCCFTFLFSIRHLPELAYIRLSLITSIHIYTPFRSLHSHLHTWKCAQLFVLLIAMSVDTFVPELKKAITLTVYQTSEIKVIISTNIV